MDWIDLVNRRPIAWLDNAECELRKPNQRLSV